MNDHILRQAEDMMRAAKDIRVPENVQAMAEEGVVRTREAYNKFAAVAHSGAKALEEVVQAQSSGAKVLGDKLVQNMMSNTDAAFDAARAMARAKSLPDAAKVQADFVQQSVAKAGEQTREFIELSSKIARQTFETLNSATAKTFNQMKAD